LRARRLFRYADVRVAVARNRCGAGVAGDVAAWLVAGRTRWPGTLPGGLCAARPGRPWPGTAGAGIAGAWRRSVRGFAGR
ncbi:hypothetical protein QCF01_18905, partial [Staphylococcus aureus]|nr:hypothetical protein [Staphylococcus aureus]